MDYNCEPLHTLTVTVSRPQEGIVQSRTVERIVCLLFRAVSKKQLSSDLFALFPLKDWDILQIESNCGYLQFTFLIKISFLEPELCEGGAFFFFFFF